MMTQFVLAQWPKCCMKSLPLHDRRTPHAKLFPTPTLLFRVKFAMRAKKISFFKTTFSLATSGPLSNDKKHTFIAWVIATYRLWRSSSGFQPFSSWGTILLNVEDHWAYYLSTFFMEPCELAELGFKNTGLPKCLPFLK